MSNNFSLVNYYLCCFFDREWNRVRYWSMDT